MAPAVHRMLSRVAVASVTALASCASGHVAPLEEEPPLVRAYDVLVADLETVADSSPQLSSTRLGTVAYGSFAEPLLAMHYEPPASDDLAPEARVPEILVVAAVHGNEPASAEWAVALVRSLATDPVSAPRARIDVIPVLNPWGWAHDLRFDADGRDINRDFATFSTQEARLVRRFLGERHWDLVLDHHEDPDATGFYLYQYGLDDDRWSREVIEATRAAGIPIEQEVSMVVLTTEDGLIDAPMWGLRYMRTTGPLSLANFARLAKNPRVYTIETPTTLPLEERVAAHHLAYRILMERVLEPPAAE